MRDGDGILMAVGAVFLAAIIVFVTWVIVHSQDEENAFKVKCNAANGTVMDTRDNGLCFQGNVLLFSTEW